MRKVQKKTVLKEKGHHKFQQVESKEVVWNVSIDRITYQTKPKLTVDKKDVAFLPAIHQ